MVVLYCTVHPPPFLPVAIHFGDAGLIMLSFDSSALVRAIRFCVHTPRTKTSELRTTKI